MASKTTKVESADLLRSSLYSQHSTLEVLQDYEQQLRATGDFDHIAHAAKILEYRKLITNRKFLAQLRNNFNDLYKMIDKGYPHLHFNIIGRRKSLINVEKKINKLMSEGKSLDLLRDLYGIRIMTFEHSNTKAITTCYSICTEIIEFFLTKGFTLCEADKITGTDKFDISKHSGIFVPKKSGIPEKYWYGVKDYILTPKNNGYQSLHLVFRAPTGECFEVQIRTFAMHIHAEHGAAEHSDYKTQKYDKHQFTFDRKKIQMNGYDITSDGNIVDYIGLENALQILQRQKTF